MQDIKKIDKQTVIDTLQRWIDSSFTHEQLIVCWVAVHDLLWTRYGDDRTANELKLQISEKRAGITGE